MSEKLKIIKNVGETQEFEADSCQKKTTIDSLLQWLNDAKNNGATHVNWRARTFYDGDSMEVEAYAYFEHIETDEEYQIRQDAEIKKQEANEEIRLKKERTLYEELKKKFES